MQMDMKTDCNALPVALINCVLQNMSINSDTSMCRYGYKNNFRLCNYRYSRTLKTIPVQSIDTMELWIFQNTENYFQCKALILCNYRYSRTLKTIPVQNIDTVQLWIFQTTENYSSILHEHLYIMQLWSHL